MTLFEKLQKATSEEDVKDAHIKALGLKEYQKNLIDIQTKEIWFEAKQNAKLSSYAMFTQLMHYVQEALDAISAHIGTHFVSFKIETHEDEFISTVKNAIKSGDVIRTQITPGNLKQVFDKWVLMIGLEIKGIAEEDYALLFFADIMHDGTADKTLSNEANQVLMTGKVLWQAYFEHTDVRAVRDELKLNRSDVGWYQVRKALTEKLQPKVYELGFLRN